MQVITYEGWNAIVLRLLYAATGSFLEGAELGLFTNDIAPNVNTVKADLVEPTYVGYTPPTIDEAPAYGIDDAGQLMLVYPHASFILGEDVPEGVRIYGWFLSSATNQLLCVHRYDEPEDLVTRMDLLIVEPTFVLGQPQDV